jgi:hypothetical protein
MGGIAPGIAVPAVGGTCGWDEPFDDADFTAFKAKYTGSYGSWNQLLSSNAEATDVEVSLGRLRLKGTSTGNQYGLTFGPPRFLSTREYWYRIQCEMIGGTYDAPVTDDPYLMEAIAHGGISSGCAVALTGAPLTQNPIDPYPRSGNVWVLNQTDATQPNVFFTAGNVLTAISDIMPAGVHDFVMCISEPTSTSYQAELWYDASTGDAPDATVARPKFAGDGVTNVSAQFKGPVASGLVLAIDRVQFICSNRASNPFGIL